MYSLIGQYWKVPGSSKGKKKTNTSYEICDITIIQYKCKEPGNEVCGHIWLAKHKIYYFNHILWKNYLVGLLLKKLALESCI